MGKTSNFGNSFWTLLLCGRILRWKMLNFLLSKSNDDVYFVSWLLHLAAPHVWFASIMLLLKFFNVKKLQFVFSVYCHSTLLVQTNQMPSKGKEKSVTARFTLNHRRTKNERGVMTAFCNNGFSILWSRTRNWQDGIVVEMCRIAWPCFQTDNINRFVRLNNWLNVYYWTIKKTF